MLHESCLRRVLLSLPNGGNAQRSHPMYILHRVGLHQSFSLPLNAGLRKPVSGVESPLFDPEVGGRCSHTHTHAGVHVYCNGVCE